MRPVFCAALLVFFEGIVIWSVFPTMTYFLQDLGGEAFWIGILFALMSGPKIVMNPVFGRLSDRIGRRPVLIFIMLGAIGGSVAWALAPSVGWLAVSRGIAGIFAAQAALSQTVVADATRPERRAAAMGVLGAAFGLSMIVGPLLGGWVGHAWGSYAAIGWACAAVQTLSLLVLVVFMPETRVRPERARAQPQMAGMRGVLREPNVVPLLAVTLLMTLAFAELTSTFASLSKDQYQLKVSDTTRLFVLLGIVALVTQGGILRLLLPRFAEKGTALLGLLLLAVGLGWLGILPARGSVWWALGLVAAGSALAMPTLTALLSRCVGADRQGSLQGMHQSVTALGRAVGALAGGFVYAQISRSSPYFSAVGVALVAIVMLWTVRTSGTASDRPESLQK